VGLRSGEGLPFSLFDLSPMPCNGPAHLSNVAGETIQMATADADRSAGLIRVVGPVDYATVVKDE